jgi:hypothetical protein
MEIWKPLLGYEGIYEISTLGKIKSLSKVIYKNNKYHQYKEKTLKTRPDVNGYVTINLYKNKIPKTLRIHVLMAINFLNHTPNKHTLVVNHKNHDKLDNTIENLELITQRENTNKKHIKSLSKYTGVTKSKNNWMSRIMINGKSVFLGSFKCETKAHLAYEKQLKILSDLKDRYNDNKIVNSLYLNVGYRF